MNDENREGKKILIVEDDQFLANAYRVKLTKANYNVTMAADGQKALAILQTFIPDLIILDLVMPEMDGFSLLEKIKTNQKLAHIPVIVASNLNQEEDLKKAKQLGANDYIIKVDLNLSEVIEKVEKLLISK